MLKQENNKLNFWKIEQDRTAHVDLDMTQAWLFDWPY